MAKSTSRSTRRRSPGEGTVYRRKDRGGWRGEMTWTDPDGASHRRDVPTSFEVGEWVAMDDIVPNWLMPDGSRGEMRWVALYRVVAGKIVSLQLFPGPRPG